MGHEPLLKAKNKNALMTSLASDLARPESSHKQLAEPSRTTYRVPPRPQKLVVIVPAHNEEKTIGQVIANIPCTIDDVEEVKVVVVNDCSTDRTAEIAREAGAIVVSHPNRHGVGAAFMTGVDAALRLQADVIVNMDGDGQFDSQDISKLIRPILYESHGFVTCTRFADPANYPQMPRLKLWGNRMMCRLINLIIWRGNFTDVSCGFRAYSRETALQLNLYGRFTYTQESFIDLASKGILMTEIPLRVRGTREFGKSKVASNLFWYTLQTVPIMARAVRDVRPLTFFGTIGLVFLLLGCTMFGFVGVWWLIHERTSPWTSLLTIGSGSVVMGLVIGFIALIADQIGRGRRIDEQLLYYARVRYFKEFADDSPSSPGAEARPGSHEDVSPARPFEK